ncbi:hypothetical protein L873DRAFT_1850888 [Choiromyces venosus 120613-1]|uniref:DNA helicase n=1 Tax=Choiromyces venosus 120613-1 TaxID=1336337 RepID=A0A3N4K6H3_9PEZI|nr:hypothetical protein L873DRAFT_1850888 [Choiromyces venosus 120613-1]
MYPNKDGMGTSGGCEIGVIYRGSRIVVYAAAAGRLAYDRSNEELGGQDDIHQVNWVERLKELWDNIPEEARNHIEWITNPQTIECNGSTVSEELIFDTLSDSGCEQNNVSNEAGDLLELFEPDGFKVERENNFPPRIIIGDWEDAMDYNFMEPQSQLLGEVDTNQSHVLRLIIEANQAYGTEHNWLSDLEQYGGVDCVEGGESFMRTEINRVVTSTHNGDVEPDSIVDPMTLNSKQREVYELILSHYHKQQEIQSILLHHGGLASKLDPLHIIVSGTAGSGKSYTINAIKDSLNAMNDYRDSESVLCVTAFTGVAAFNG